MGRIYLNDNWGFTEEFSEELLATGDYAGALTQVRIPHTCKELPYNYFDESQYQMLSGYRRVLFAQKEWEGKSIILTFEGVGHQCELYLNGQLLYMHACGYTAFSVDIAEYLIYGEDNYLVLKVDSRENLNVPPFGFVIDYMTYGGVYRDVYLEVKEHCHITDVFVKTDNIAEDNHCEITCDITLSQGVLDALHTSEADNWSIISYLSRVNTDICPVNEADIWKYPQKIGEKPLLNAQSEHIELHFSIENVQKWDEESPFLYTIRHELCKGTTTMDTYSRRIGFRTVEFKAEGFFLNGKKVKIRGLNRHQSYPYVGYAMPESMQRLDADILKKELGCNAVRTSHYPQSHYFVERCDELGLLVFMEFPGWQHIGDEAWKEQACKNVSDMIVQFRNHPSIMIWGVRINESQDDDAFYEKTNAIAHALDDSRQTGGVRNFKNSHLLEDVYTYNEFVHDGIKPGCEPKKKVTSDMKKGYLITEYNGHMYPTKAFDWEEKRLEHALRHVRVLDAVGKEEDIAGSFGWCMFDYNTHKDFGSGDRICYHGVMDMFRNPKLAASVYASQQEKDVVLEVSSSMDIGEHPATNLGSVYIFTNADSVRMYKNEHFIKEYYSKDSGYKGLKRGPILIDDFIGDMLVTNEHFKPKQAKIIADAMNYIAVHGYQKFPPHIIFNAIKCIVQYRMKPDELVGLYTKYVGNWGETATVYRFEAIKDGKVVKNLLKEPMHTISLDVKQSHTTLMEGKSYDVAAIRIRSVDENGNITPFFQEPIMIETEGVVELIGPDVISLKGGMGGFYVKSIGEIGKAKVYLKNAQLKTVTLDFAVAKEKQDD